jgi:two-component system OmpR family response regulator
MGKKALFIGGTMAYPAVAGLLSEAGFGVTAGADPETGLRQLERESYDIAVVIDSHGSESWQLCQRIRGLTAIPIIVISASASPEACARAIYAGADFFMRKPFGPREFLARVNSLLQRPSLRQAVPIG